MKAAILREVDRPLEIEEVQVDNPGPREVLIRTGATGVCHSDLHFVEGKYRINMPAVLGHEAAGTVEAVGSQVSYVQPGDRVITCLSVFCGLCDRCLSGRPNLCYREDVVRSPAEPPRLRQGNDRITQMAEISSFAEQMLVQRKRHVQGTGRRALRAACPHRVRGHHRRWRGDQHRQGRARQHGSGHRLRRCGPQRHPGGNPGRGAPGHRHRPGGNQADDGHRIRGHRRHRRVWAATWWRKSET